MAKNVVQDFKKFVNKGNVFDLAIGVIIGTTFTAIVNSLVNDIIMPLVSSAINFDLTSAKIVLREEVLDAEENVVVSEITLNYGNFFQNVITFLIIAISIFVAVKVVKSIHQGYIKQEIKYIKALKVKHPELFDEKDEFGTKLYERLKKDHPEFFKTEIAKEIEEAKKNEQQQLSPMEINNNLLIQLNENLARMNGTYVEEVENNDGDTEEVPQEEISQEEKNS